MKAVVILTFLLASASLQAQTITTLFSSKAICPRDSVDVQYQATGSFEENNLFKAQLSNSEGSFESFQFLGSVMSKVSGSIRIGIPDDFRESGMYRIRVISTSPYIVGSDNGQDIFIPSVHSYYVESTPYHGVVMDSFQLMAMKDHKPVVAPFGYGWDFGEGATPKIGYGNPPPKIVYKTPGRKMGRVSITFGAGCTYTMNFYIDIADCFPKIPNNARIVDADTIYGPRSGHTWVRSGGRYRGVSNEIIYADGGAVIEDGGDASILYLKPGAEFLNADASFVVFGEGASPGSGFNVVQCKPLDFDYSEAPTPEQYASVSSRETRL